ncbi:MAG: hypothetical protein K8T90_10850 [Planctomycetes bacterium]|nr:hypothetical protein [Planctomycetota bacterium]
MRSRSLVNIRTFTAVALVAAATATIGFAPAHDFTATATAAPLPTAALGAGGTARGDISLTAGDEDLATIDLVEGSALSAKFASGFAATVEFTAPDGAVIDLGWGTGNKRAVKAFPITKTGRFQFRIRSAAGAQGTYSLTALASWPKKVTLSGATGGSVSWSMPKGASVSGKVAAFPARSWDPVLESVMGMGGNLLTAPIAGTKGIAKLPKLTAGVDGPCTMNVSGGTPGGQFRAALVLSVPKVKPTAANVSNGLTVISFANDGVKALIVKHCAGCHVWTASAAAFKSHAKPAVPRMQSGNMPQGAARLPNADIQLISNWIATGMNP